MHERPRPARFQFNGDFGQQPNIPAAHIRSQKRVLLSPDETPGHRQPVGGIACGIRFPGIPLIFNHDSLQLRKIRIVRKIVVGRAHPSARHSARPGNDARHVPAVKPADRVPERRIRDSGNGDERYQRIAGDKHDPGIAAGGGSPAPGYRRVKPIHSEAYAAGELKHGTISLIERGTLVIGVLTQSELYEKTISNMLECKSRGAYLMGLTTYGKYEIEDQVNFTVYVPKVDEHFVGSLAVIPLQLLGYYVSVAKGLDVDKPRNLAKSVTVE